MFKIKLVDIEYEGYYKEFDTPLDTLEQVEELIKGDICYMLNSNNVKLIYDDELVYEVYSDGRSVGLAAVEIL